MLGALFLLLMMNNVKAYLGLSKLLLSLYASSPT